jgi:hypothetical protein
MADAGHDQRPMPVILAGKTGMAEKAAAAVMRARIFVLVRGVSGASPQ